MTGLTSIGHTASLANLTPPLTMCGRRVALFHRSLRCRTNSLHNTDKSSTVTQQRLARAASSASSDAGGTDLPTVERPWAARAPSGAACDGRTASIPMPRKAMYDMAANTPCGNKRQCLFNKNGEHKPTLCATPYQQQGPGFQIAPP